MQLPADGIAGFSTFSVHDDPAVLHKKCAAASEAVHLLLESFFGDKPMYVVVTIFPSARC